MNAKEFLKQLDKLYNEGKDGILCKFYMQATTFSFELHDKKEMCFTKESLSYESETMFWTITDIKSYKFILNEIYCHIKQVNQRRLYTKQNLIQYLTNLGFTFTENIDDNSEQWNNNKTGEEVYFDDLYLESRLYPISFKYKNTNEEKIYRFLKEGRTF